MLGRLVRAARGSTPEPDGQAVALQPVPPDAAAAQAAAARARFAAAWARADVLPASSMF